MTVALVVRSDAASVASFGRDMMSAVRAFDAVQTGLSRGLTACSAVARFLDGGSPAPTTADTL